MSGVKSRTQILIFCTVLFSCVNGFANSCLYQGYESSYKKSYVFFTALEKLGSDLSKEKEITESKFRDFFEQALNYAFSECQSTDHSYPAASEDALVIVSENAIVFRYNQREHKIRLRRKDNFFNLSYFPLFGSYQSVTNFQVSFDSKHSKVFNQFLSRKKGSDEIKNYVFGSKAELLGEFADAQRSHSDFKSLQEIYGASPAIKTVSPKIKVGIIGTGVDYNHPAIAKHLVGRGEFEDDLIRLNKLREKILNQAFFNTEDYLNDMLLLEKKEASVGFPKWMDQGLNSVKPYDQLIPTPSLGNTVQHETVMASRILASGRNIGLFSVRLNYENNHPRFIKKIIAKFHERGVRVVNMSFGVGCKNDLEWEAGWSDIFEEYSDIIFVTSAGNSGYDMKAFCSAPASYSVNHKNLISVTALDSQLQPALNFGIPVNYGEEIDVAVVSENLLVRFPAPASTKENIIEDQASTSLAAAEVSRIISEAILNGVPLAPQNVKASLQRATVLLPHLKLFVKTSGYINETQLNQ